MSASILVIEDDSSIRNILYSRIFKFTRIQCRLCRSDGLEGISKFKQGNYDLIILDIMMPNLDGYCSLQND